MLYGGGEEKAIWYVSVKSSLTDFFKNIKINNIFVYKLKHWKAKWKIIMNNNFNFEKNMILQWKKCVGCLLHAMLLLLFNLLCLFKQKPYF